ncbi:hypothetical protein BDQ17DRAFT_312304 [Cyathus striatus]|nr:hypothetical protein BDQ17DRAFT_312304 [Cyathus striatus]
MKPRPPETPVLCSSQQQQQQKPFAFLQQREREKSRIRVAEDSAAPGSASGVFANLGKMVGSTPKRGVHTPSERSYIPDDPFVSPLRPSQTSSIPRPHSSASFRLGDPNVSDASFLPNLSLPSDFSQESPSELQMSRAASRASSRRSVGGSTAGDSGAALGEVKRLYRELAEKTQHSESLLTQLLSATSAHENLSREHHTALTDLSNSRTLLASTQSELSELRSQLATVQAELESAKCSKSALENELDSARGEKNNVEEALKRKDEEAREGEKMKAEVERLRVERDRDVLAREETERKAVNAKKSVEGLSESYTALQATFKALKRTHDASQVKLSNALKEVLETKRWASEIVSKIEPMMDESYQYTHSRNIRALIAELQDELSSSQRVNDLLRDKLHHHASQLAESQNRIADLEKDKNDAWKRNVVDTEGVLATQKEIKEILEKMKMRELETIDALAEAAALDIRFSETKRVLEEKEVQVAALTSVKESAELSLSLAQAEIVQYTAEIGRLKLELASSEEKAGRVSEELRDVKKNVVQKEEELKKRESALNAQVLEINALKAQLTNVEQSLSVATAADKKSKVENSCLTLRVAMASGKVEMLEADLARARKDAESRDEMFRKASNSLLILQERFDAQGVTLRLAKEQCGDLQERLSQTESSAAAKLERAIGEYKSQLAVLQEQKTASKASLDELRNELSATRATHNQAIFEFEKRFAAQDAEKGTVVKRAQAAELELQKLKVQLEKAVEEAGGVRELEEKLRSVKVELEVARRMAGEDKRMLEDARRREEDAKRQAEEARKRAEGIKKQADESKTQAEETGKQLQESKEQVGDARGQLEAANKQVETVRKQLEETKQQAKESKKQLEAAKLSPGVDEAIVASLQAKIEEMQERLDIKKLETLRLRYERGQLTDEEKDFVSHLIKLAQSMHEEATVLKDNEIRRRDNTINTLQKKISSLESTLAKKLNAKTRGNEVDCKPMMDLGLWMSSPLSVIEENLVIFSFIEVVELTSVVDQAETDEPPPPPPPLPALETPCQQCSDPPLAPPKKPAVTFAELSALETEDEDDVPVSQLSRLSSEKARKRARPPSPIPAPEEPVRSRRRVYRAGSMLTRAMSAESQTQTQKPVDVTATRTRQKKRK